MAPDDPESATGGSRPEIGPNYHLRAIGPPNVADDLLSSSEYFAQSAIKAYSNEDWSVFFLHIATAAEQIVKAALALVDPSFIADSRADFDSLLHLTGHGDKARVPSFVSAVRTITASEALTRVSRVVDGYQQAGTRVRLLLDTRNGIAHAGYQSKAEAESVLGEVAQWMGPLLDAVGTKPATYWGEAFGIVDEHAQRRLSEVEAAYQRRLQAAKDRYRQTTASMDAVALNAFLAAVAARPLTSPFETAPMLCPACGNLGELGGTPEALWEPDWDDEAGEPYAIGATVETIQLFGREYACRACGLRLEAVLLPFADLASVFLSNVEFDVSDATAFFEAQIVDDIWPEGS